MIEFKTTILTVISRKTYRKFSQESFVGRQAKALDDDDDDDDDDVYDDDDGSESHNST